jgi:hypothetical protein
VCNPYMQVALTYIRRMARILLAGVGLLFAIYVAAGIAIFFGGLWRGNLELFTLLFPLSLLNGVVVGALHKVRICLVLVMILCFGVASHVRGQFANSRARLVPGYARVHFTVAAVAALITAGLVPALLAWFAGFDPVGFLAIAVFMSGVLHWTRSFRGLGLAALVGFYCCIAASDDGVEWIQHALEDLISGRADGIAILLFGLGGLTMFLAWRRLLRFRADMSGYDHVIQTGARVNVAAIGQVEGWASRSVQWIQGLNEEREMTRLIGHARSAYTSPWSCVCRWQVGMVASRSAWIWTVTAVLFAQFLMRIVGSSAHFEPTVLFWITSLCWLILVPFLSLTQLSQRAQSIRCDLLMPVERGVYLRQLGMAVLLAQYQLWSAAGVSTILSWLIAVRQSVPPMAIVGALTISAMVQVTLFGAALWLMRHPSLALWLIVLIFIGASPAMGAAQGSATWLAERPYLACSAGAAILAALDAAMIWAAYRRWLVTDFD